LPDEYEYEYQYPEKAETEPSAPRNTADLLGPIPEAEDSYQVQNEYTTSRDGVADLTAQMGSTSLAPASKVPKIHVAPSKNDRRIPKEFDKSQ
jgi:hypothetical protein